MVAVLNRVVRVDFSEKVRHWSKDLKGVREQPQGYLEEEQPHRGSSQFKGPKAEVDAWCVPEIIKRSVFLEQREQGGED